MQQSPMRTVHAGYTVLCTDMDGWVDGGRNGLFDYDTRILSRFRLTIDGRPPQLVGAHQPESDSFVARYRIPLGEAARGGGGAGGGGERRGSAAGPLLPQDAIDLRLDRVVGLGMRDSWSIENHSALPWAAHAWLDIDGDFADVAEVGRDRRQAGDLVADVRGRTVELRYRARRDGKRFERAVRVRVQGRTVPVDASERGIGLELAIPAGATLALEVRVASRVAGLWRAPGVQPRTAAGNGANAGREAWRARRPRVDAPVRLQRPFERALEDLFALRNQDLERDLLPEGAPGRRGWILNAGIPTFTGFFGRDSLPAGWQGALAGTGALRGALEVTAARQATTDDPWRDAEPGKMLHELRRGPLTALGISPRDAYYGSHTTPAMFVLALSELWHWTGSEQLLRRFRAPAARAIDWAERTCQQGDGFLMYEQRSPEGLRNQGWKDSDEAIRHADGRIAETRLATVEEQAFHFLALQRMAEIHVALDEPERADVLLEHAAAVRRHWHESFWMPREGYYALALEPGGRQVESITSNPGHALGTGIVPPDYARAVADRLLSPSLFNGWGVRTLADDHPSYNPLAYHLGTVWPVENATFALGFKRYGLDEHADRLIEAQLEAAAAMDAARLPEALTGHRREAGVPPWPYPNACAPQAWSASAVIQLVQIMLGLYPFAPLRLLSVIRPRLPAWLPELTLRNVRVGRARVDLAFKRRKDGSASYRVVRRSGQLLVVPAGPPVDVNGGPRSWVESLGKAALERAPGRLVRAARISIGME
jgi:glycogen debranching enzyme